MEVFTRNRQIHSSLLGVLLLSFHLIVTGGSQETAVQDVDVSELDWISNDNNFQYFVSQTPEETSQTWHSARSWCMTNYADLASILDSDENDLISSLVNQTGYQGSFWTGINRLQSETWSWTDGEVVNYTNWEATFPVDDTEILWKCGYSHLNGLWKNEHCETKRGYVCKRPVDVVTTIKTDPASTPVAGYCPAGYFSVVNSNKCLRVVKLDVNANEGITWNEAAAICRDAPGIYPDLASIADENEYNAIMARLEEHTDGVWIGMRGESSVETFKWIDNSPVVFSNWAPNEPLGTDPCVEIWMLPGPPGTWNNIVCEKKRGYICQTFKDPAFVISTPAATTPNLCQDGYAAYSNACYKLNEISLSWSEAEAQCIQDGGQLASIHSEPENSAVTVYLSTVGSYDFVWIGLKYLVNESVYYWSDNWHVIYTKWAAGQPNRTTGGGCVGVDPEGMWRDSICDNSAPSLCKITTEPPNTTPPQMEGTCPTNSTNSLFWVPYGGHCYGLSTYGATNNWDFAQQTCATAVPGRPCNLASIHDSLEGRFVGELILRYSYSMYDSHWIGMRKSGVGMSYTWVDSTEVEYTNWNPGEPNDADGSQNCVRSYYKNFANTWDDYSCTSQYLPFVCKIEKLPYPTTPPTPPVVDGMCPSAEWVSYGADCYLFRPDTYVTWDEADQDCKSFGTALTTIFNKDENWFVHHRLRETSWFPFVRQFWIGLSKQQNGDTYVWSDGQSLDNTNYTNWRSGSPIQNSSRMCVDLHGGSEEDEANSARWTSTNCADLRGYACRIAKGAVTPPNPASESSGPDAGAIVGAVFGIIIGVGLIAAASFFGYRWYKGRPSSTSGGSSGVSNVSYDNSSHNGSARNGTSSDGGDQINYFGELESQDLASVRIGRLELKE